jgi:hypothetical protein
MHVSLGTNLNSLESAIRESYGTMCVLSQNIQLRALQPVFQYVLSMQSDALDWENMSVLTDEIMNENDYFEEARATNKKLHIWYALLMKAHIAILFCQFSVAASTYEQFKASCDFLNLLCSAFVGPSTYWNMAWVKFGLYEKSGRPTWLNPR